MRRKYSKKDYDKVMNLFREKKNIKEISEELGIPRGTIHGWTKRNLKPYSISEKWKEAQRKENKKGYWTKDNHWSKNPELKKQIIKKMSNSLKGRKAWDKGKKLSKKHKQKLSEIKKQLYKEGKIKSPFTKKGDNLKIDRIREKTQFKKGHKPLAASPKISFNEENLLKIIRDNYLPYKYVGNGKFWLDNICPDFLNCNGEKKVIELHDSFGKKWFEKRKKIFNKYGFKYLIVLNKELKEPERIISKIRGFEYERK